jgi:acyl-coenzyme A thioesterase PaaI-like protein
MTDALNETLLKGNNCFGCGPDNPDGLRIRIFRDAANASRLVGTWRTRETLAGFPRIVHGGLQFTALDCMAGWVMFVLRQPGRMMPLTKNASAQFIKPARVGTEFALSAEVLRDAGSPRESCLIRGELRDPEGVLLTQVDFDYVLVPQERFMRAVGLEAMPDTYRRHFGDAA